MPKYNGSSKSKKHGLGSKSTKTCLSKEEAVAAKSLFYKATCDRGHNGLIRTQSGRCYTCERLGRYS